METGEKVRDSFNLKRKGIVLSANVLGKFAEVLIVVLEKGQFPARRLEKSSNYRPA
ncbi:MAG: hypothetical protein LBR79_01670 [Oscillospiraceae bacterium]|nr:hypothetical protein [Oscillospiraceae bacterium]